MQSHALRQDLSDLMLTGSKVAQQTAMDEKPKWNLNQEIETAFYDLFFALDAGPDELDQLCDWCGRGIHAIVCYDWVRISMGCGWDPRDTQLRERFRRLLKNLASMHRCKCKPYTAYDDYCVDSTTGGIVFGTQTEAKNDAMWGWYGRKPHESDGILN